MSKRAMGNAVVRKDTAKSPNLSTIVESESGGDSSESESKFSKAVSKPVAKKKVLTESSSESSSECESTNDNQKQGRGHFRRRNNENRAQNQPHCSNVANSRKKQSIVVTKNPPHCSKNVPNGQQEAPIVYREPRRDSREIAVLRVAFRLIFQAAFDNFFKATKQNYRKYCNDFYDVAYVLYLVGDVAQLQQLGWGPNDYICCLVCCIYSVKKIFCLFF